MKVQIANLQGRVHSGKQVQELARVNPIVLYTGVARLRFANHQGDYMLLCPSSKATMAAVAHKLGRHSPSSKARKAERVKVEIANLQGRVHSG